MITALVGENRFALAAELKKITEQFIKEHGDLAVERLDGEEASYEVMLGAVESQPFLSQKKLVIIKNPSQNKDFQDDFEHFQQRIAESTELLIVEGKLDKRTQYYKQLKRLPNFVECAVLDSRNAPDWISDYVSQLGGSISNSDARFLVDRVGANQQQLASELEKLIIYSPKITRQTIELLSEPTPQGTVFQMLDAAFSSNSRRAISLYDEQRRQRVEPQAIIGMIAWQVHLIALSKSAADKNSEQIARDAKASPFAVDKSLRIAQKLSVAQVRELTHMVTELDTKLKTTSIDADSAMRQAINDIANMI